MNENIAVSVVCNAYNHENYIRDALESFLMQKTNFKFEVLIHDDASTDKTAEIIRAYEIKYPDIIKPVYQKENQYSKGIPYASLYQYPRVKGKYIAVCEGDDYWTDPYKLQKQFDALESCPQVDICAHTADVVEAETKKTVGQIKPAGEDKIFSTEDVIFGGGGFVATNSLMYRSEVSTLEHPPFRQFLSLDYTLQIQGSLRGGMLYLKDNMASYRRCAKGSWTSRMSKEHEKYKAHCEKVKKMMLILDEFTNQHYHEIIQRKMRLNDFELLNYFDENKKMLSKEYRDIFNKLSFKERLKIRIKAYFPFLMKLKRKFSRNK